MKGEPVIALISGATGGIGAETARQLAASGATVILSARHPERAAAAAAPIAGDVRALSTALDVGDQRSVDAAAEALATEPGALDVLVNNAAAHVDWSETA